MHLPKLQLAAIFFTALALLTMGTMQAQAAITDGLEAYWTFDAINAGFVDDSAAGAYPGLVVGNVTADTGIIGGALNFGGGANNSDYVTVGDYLDPGLDSYTTSFWFQAATVAEGNADVFISKGNAGSSDPGYMMYVNGVGNPICVRGSGPNGSTERAEQRYTAAFDTEWHHLAMVFDRTNEVVRGYYNGINIGWSTGYYGVDDQLVAGSTITAPGKDLTFGTNPGITSYDFSYEGKMDDVGMWRRALGEDEIYGIYKAGVEGTALSSAVPVAVPQRPERPGDVAGGPVVTGGTTPYAWYRADEGVVTWEDANETELTAWWSDQSGNNRHLEVVAGNPQLTANGNHGRASLTFDGDDKIHSPATDWGTAAAGTVLAVWKASGFSTDHTDTNLTFLYDGSDPADGERDRQFLLYGDFQGALETDWMQGGGYDDDNDSYNGGDRVLVDAAGLGDSVLDQWFVTAVTHTTGTDDKLRVNGDEIFSGNMLSSGINGLNVGYAVNGSYGYQGELCELIVFEGLLSQTELEAVEQELMARWGMAAQVPGDATGDGIVNVSDLGVLATNYGAGSGFGWSEGDFTGDGFVDVDDLGVLATYYGTGTAAQAVPEPSSLVLLAGLSLLVAFRRNRR